MASSCTQVHGDFIVVLVYFVWNLFIRKKKNKRSFVINSFVMLLCPVAGPLFYILAFFFLKIFFAEEVDLEDVIFCKERVTSFVHAEEERESNVVPLEEAIEITDEISLRGLMMNVVRGDIQKSLSAISLALNSEDTETAHYAASVLQDALNDFKVNVEKQYAEIRKEDGNWVTQTEILIDYMNQVLEQNVFTDMEQRKYVYILDHICELLYRNAKERMTSTFYEAVSLRLLGIKDYEKCHEWCERAVEQYPNTLATYTCQLKLYFTNGQKEQFFDVIERLKRSAVVIDSETLELIRVFR